MDGSAFMTPDFVFVKLKFAVWIQYGMILSIDNSVDNALAILVTKYFRLGDCKKAVIVDNPDYILMIELIGLNLVAFRSAVDRVRQPF